MQKQRVRRDLSSHAPARPQTARLKHVRHIETPRSAKHEANNRLYKIWPLWQNVSIRIVFISVAKTSAHSCLHCPSAILQREGFWQHKGLGKHINTYYDFGCECHPDLQRIGNTETEKGLASCWRQIFNFWSCNAQFLFFLNRLTAQAIPQGSGGTPSMNITLLSSLQTALLSKLFDHTRIPPQTMNSPHMLLTRKLCWLIVTTLSNEKNRETVRQNAPSSNHRCQKLLQWFWTRSQQTQSHRYHPAPRAIKTQPLSNCVVRACAYQRTRQRKMGIAKKTCESSWRLFGKGRMFGRPFFKTNTQELSTPMCPPRKSWTTQRMCQSTKHCQSQLLPNIFILQLRRNIPWTIMTLIVFCLEIMQWTENASTLTQDLVWDDAERHLLELTLEPNHETWLKKAQLLICAVLPQLPNPNGHSSYWRSRFALRTWQGRNRNNKKCVLNMFWTELFKPPVQNQQTNKSCCKTHAWRK